MQLFALDNRQQVIIAKLAVKQQDYYCLECNSVVRLRGGLHRQMHFYHVDPDRVCSQKAKSMAHLQTQCYLQQALPFGEAALEVRFPEIGRIADVVWRPQKMIFEVQCSFISAEEVEARNRDYARLGYQVIWILHDKRYNQWRLTAAEAFLRHEPCYFTNIDDDGKGMIYDQYDHYDKGKRKNTLDPLPLQIDQLYRRDQDVELPNNPPGFIAERIENRKVWFGGDLMHCFLSGQATDYLHKSADAHVQTIKPPTTHRIWRKLWSDYVVRPYALAMQILLESSCR